MRRIRLAPVLIAAAAALGASPVSAGTAPPSASPEDQAAADEAIAAFTEFATDAGFVSVGPGQDGDLLGLASEEDDPASACYGDLSPLIDPADGRFVGETARAVSDEFGIVSEDATTDVLGGAWSEDSLDAAVVFGDAAATEGFASIVERLNEDDFGQCLVDLTEEAAGAPSSSDGYEMSLQYDVEPLDVADGGATLLGEVQASYGGQELSFSFSGAIARADNALVIVSYDYGAEPGADVDIVDAVETMVDALS